MKNTLVVTADDFGLCAQTNDAICLLHDHGIVRRTSLLVNTPSFDSSVDALRRRPHLEVAVHLNVTDGCPILPAAQVPSLVDANGVFYGGRHYGIVARIVSGRMNRTEIHREWRAQVMRARSSGLVIRQLNSHGHLHLLPPLHGIVEDLLREFAIREVRLVRSLDSARGLALHVCSFALLKRLRRHGFDMAAPGRTLGLRTPGSVDPHVDLRTAAGAEFIVHPATGPNEYHARWGYAGDEVLAYLLRDAGPATPAHPSDSSSR